MLNLCSKKGVTNEPISFKQRVFNAAKNSKKHARRNYYAAYIVASLSVLSSIAASLCVHIEGLSKDIISLIAALPSCFLLLNYVFKFEVKSAWHWRKNKKLMTIFLAMEYEDLTDKDASKKISDIEESMDNNWITFGDMAQSGK